MGNFNIKRIMVVTRGISPGPDTRRMVVKLKLKVSRVATRGISTGPDT